MNDSIFYGFGSSDDGNISVAVCSDPKLEFEIVLDPEKVDIEIKDKVEWLDKDRVDYNLVLPEHKDTYLEEIGVPLSFLEVRTVDEGMLWYSEHTDMPDCMVPYLAEYHWCKPTTPETPKAQKKKKPVPKMEIKHGKFRVEFN